MSGQGGRASNIVAFMVWGVNAPRPSHGQNRPATKQSC